MAGHDDQTTGAITALLARRHDGDPSAIAALAPLIYDELVLLARAQRRRWAGDPTLNTTALAHEAWLKVVERSGATWLTRDHFFAVLATAMRHLLVDHARRGSAAKRGGDVVHVDLDDAQVAEEPDDLTTLLAIDRALERLAALSTDLARVVEYRFFAGFTVDETAVLLDASPRTVKRQWQRARLWLLDALGDDVRTVLAG